MLYNNRPNKILFYFIVQVKITTLIIIDFYKNKDKFADMIPENDKINTLV